MSLENRFRVAIFDEFLDAFAQIPRAQQKKVNKFIRLFRENPTSSSINYESISSFSDQNLKTVRIDQAYRAIILKPEQGNVYVLLWVDHHDEAMDWAKNKRVAIHPDTGALQVLTVQKGEMQAPVESEDDTKTFDHIRDRELLRLGVPEEMLAKVRAIGSIEALEELQAALPQEAFEALFFIAEGESLEDVEAAMASTPVKEVDVNDFETALDRDTSKRRFVVVDNDEALEAMLDAPLEKWRVFLHPSQRRLVNRSYNGAIRVLGGAGTGKTVVAMHRAAYLAKEVYNNPNSRILFTTFTKNLAADIQANLRKLCSADALNRIEVVNLDSWVTGLFKRSGYEFQIAYWPQNKTLRTAWDTAMAVAPPGEFAESFYRDEWELVAQASGCEDWESYKKASRSGRGVRLSRAQRKRIWPVFEEYRNQLQKRGLREPEDAFRDAAVILEKGDGHVQYDAVIVDEAQDMSTNAFALIRKIVPEGANDLFIVGDGHQRIYRRQVILGRAGINIRGRRGYRLRINYRTTDEIRRFAVSLLEGTVVDDLDGGEDTTSGYKSLMHGVVPEVVAHADFDKEMETIVAWLNNGRIENTCLVARTKKLRDKYDAALRERGIETYLVKRSTPDDPRTPGVRIATMHRVKGIEFSRMIIASVNEDLIPLKEELERSSDQAIRSEKEAWERALLYVAVTRAKKDVLITSSGKRSSWLPVT